MYTSFRSQLLNKNRYYVLQSTIKTPYLCLVKRNETIKNINHKNLQS